MEKEKIEITKEKATIKLGKEVYPIEVVYGAAYNFLEKLYFYLDYNKNEEVEIEIKPKEENSKKEFENLVREFLNELITVGLRFEIANKNKKIREYIISTALLGSSNELREEIQKEKSKEDDDNEWADDPLGIATPWEEKNNNE